MITLLFGKKLGYKFWGVLGTWDIVVAELSLEMCIIGTAVAVVVWGG